MDDPEDIAQILRRERQRRELSVRELAKRAGVSPTIVSRIENGHTSPSFATVKKILAAFGIGFSDLFGGAEHARPSPVIRKGAMRRVKGLGAGRETLLVNPSASASIQLFREEYEPGASSADAPETHESTEVGLCISGSLELELPGQTCAISGGDGWFFEPGQPHRFVNRSGGKAVIVFADVAAPWKVRRP
ncbi:MAG: helix-turn-helix domain-containing protein [Kiritimatiellae bacterium]|nr:helix-turn-helix domain-containing protein [Kiritimatiellia bacterium]